MALDDLIARLELDAGAQVDALVRAADLEIAAIVSAADQAIAARTSETLADARLARQVSYARALADHRGTLRARELAAAHAVIDRVFTRAREHLATTGSTDVWAGLWPGIASEALSYAPDRSCRVRASPEVAAILRSTASLDAGTELVEDAHLSPGLVVEALDRSLRIDATVDALLSQNRQQLAMGLLGEARDAT